MDWKKVAEGAVKAMEYVDGLVKHAALGYTPAGDAVTDLVMAIMDAWMNTRLVSDAVAVTVSRDDMKHLIRQLINNAPILEMVSDELAELASETLSDALSNAVYSGAIGAYDAMLRLLVGAQPPQGPLQLDYVDASWAAFVDALGGQLYHVTALQWISKQLGDLAKDLMSDPVFRGLVDSYVAHVDPGWFVVAMFAELFRDAVKRMVDSIIAAFEALFARIDDAAQEYIAAKILYEQGVIDEAEYEEVKARVLAEIQAAEQEIDQIIADVMTALQTMEWPLSTRLMGIEDVIGGMVRDYLADWTELDEYVQELSALRSYGKPSAVKYVVEVAGQGVKEARV